MFPVTQINSPEKKPQLHEGTSHIRKNLSAEKFVTDTDKEVYYRTGDLDRIRSDLNLEIFGRIDNQIKLRGYRIEPGEIEKALCSLTEIHEAVVKIHKSDENNQRLIAFIVPIKMKQLTAKYISSILRKKVPDYMVPSIYQAESDFPKTPNGKIDRKILKYQDDKILKSIHSINTNDNKKSDHSEIEKTIQTIWEKHLNITHADIHENLFDLGGTSITMMQIASEINETYDTMLDIVEFFDKPNIKAISTYVNNRTKTIDLVQSKNIGKDKSHELGNKRKRMI
jgi:acyl carrier protein